MTTVPLSSARPRPEVAPEVERKRQIADFVAGFSIETTPGAAAKIADYREHLRPGTTVAVTFLAGSDFGETVATARRLQREGLHPAPHLAARSIPSRRHLEEWLKRLRGEAGVREVVVLAGAVDRPLGEFDSSMQLLETGLFDKYGIERIGVAGHPEGSPDIAQAEVDAALKWKNAFAERTDAEMYIATQFVFAAAPVIDWERRIRAGGNRLPVHVGVPGLATVKTLIDHARACGVGPSMRFLTRQAKNVRKLMTVNAPDRLVADLARHAAEEPASAIAKVHIYPLGGLRKSAAWANAVADGDLTLAPDGRGFTVNREIS